MSKDLKLENKLGREVSRIKDPGESSQLEDLGAAQGPVRLEQREQGRQRVRSEVTEV